MLLCGFAVDAKINTYKEMKEENKTLKEENKSLKHENEVLKNGLTKLEAKVENI